MAQFAASVTIVDLPVGTTVTDLELLEGQAPNISEAIRSLVEGGQNRSRGNHLGNASQSSFLQDYRRPCT